MRKGRASQTAAWVAAARTLGGLLPEELAVAHDPYGVRFARGPVRRLSDALIAHPRVARFVLPRTRPLLSLLLWMQVRTRTLDDVLLEFVASGGRQLVLLGAGYDCRALRFARELTGSLVLEVDHPSTQAQKREVLARESLEHVRFVPWDFEREPAHALPERLRREGLDPTQRTLTLWEGVVVYLSESAIEDTLRAVRELGSASSLLAFTYLEKSALERPRARAKLWNGLATNAGEPWRHGFEPSELAAWLGARGYRLLRDDSDLVLARALLRGPEREHFTRETHHVAVAATQ